MCADQGATYRYPMTAQTVLDRVASWFTVENLQRHQLVIEAAVAGLYFLLFVGGVMTYGGALGLIALTLLAATIVLYRISSLFALTLGAFGTLGILGFVYQTGFFPVLVPLLFVFFGTSAYGAVVTRWLGFAGTLFATVGVVSVMGYGFFGFSGVLFLLFIEAFFALAWVAGMLVYVNRGRRAAQTGEIRATVQLGEVKHEVSLEQERNRVARDVHDIVAHSLAVVIAQANGARYTADPAAKDASLETIAGTAKQALGDVRLLLAQLRHSEAPDPVASLDDVDVLVERMRASGLDVRVERVGDRPALPRTADIAAYRILQEALTNALRHGDRAEPVHVRLDGVPVAQGGAGIVLDVHNRILSAPGHPGHGVRGMHERARLAGGDAWTGVEDGWFRVRAAFPAGLGQPSGGARTRGSAA